ncbi:MAG: hypothetical protein A2087_04600 [Spirochaetes bacterium GWD1_61_31]|nr:MAG: hypothetical protein A2Y37_09275 [Spirochaetes bacterium GWB1_60_80]OHD31610.1 MAG: hypothetical protein A2004_09490 [Spirochaetes bacterium GWC1_61_12]OHD40543.1 MAG: hypothetical protein A2087_04600 [Spirochaetes bacterium GWD1_61_31]OHD44044.1 MAG: hypothetical protein A2Y35_01775 [Spirochaetes bacterium GWE1_60_18]OHD59079.1 MAG: hypothetical protein A2Y32_02495 [Spirochaetes bacterium GWF1_60_12]
MDYVIRPENVSDFRPVEELTRKAFWNVHVPGCNEHYLVHVLRGPPDFIPELDFVLEKVGNPSNYIGALFKSCKKFNICLNDDFYPSALLAGC